MYSFALNRLGVALGFVVAAAPALAFDLSSVQRASGVWELSAADGARKCTMQLRSEAAGSVHAIGLPVGCKHAIPVVSPVVGWTLSSDNSLEFTDRDGSAVLAFVTQSNELVATGPEGEDYKLTSARAAQTTAPPRPVATDMQVAVQAQTATRAPSARANDLPGRYSVLRDGSKDTGCMLTLETAPRGSGARAQLAPACRDNGFVIFDPQSWALVGGKLNLTARKGHKAIFERAPDGTWQKDPKDGGKPLGFRKM